VDCQLYMYVLLMCSWYGQAVKGFEHFYLNNKSMPTVLSGELIPEADFCLASWYPRLIVLSSELMPKYMCGVFLIFDFFRLKQWIRGLWCYINATFNNISVISWRSVLFVEETRENHRPAASHWQTLSHNVALSTPRLSGIRTHNVNVDRHRLQR